MRLEERDTEIEPGQRRSVLSTYLSRVRAFTSNARLFLLSLLFFGVAMGISQLLFNFYVLSLGYNEATLGNLVTARSLTSLIAALPMGYLTDRIGSKNAFLIGYLAYGVSMAMMLIFPSVPIFISMNVLQGVAQSLSGVATGPFLMENGGPKERTYLFSLSSGLRMTATSIGEWLGGYLPGWAAGIIAVSAVSSKAYGWSLWVMAFLSLASAVPVILMKTNLRSISQRSAFAPVSFVRKNPGLLGKLILPSLVISIGAGMVMPFMNVFFRNVHSQSDTAIGVIFAWGSLAMGIGLVVAPALAERFGKIQVVTATQALSIPFLALLGFAPWFEVSVVAYYIRLTLMNMSGPIYSTFTMERVDPESRGMIASLSSMAGNFGWAFSPTISGLLQVRSGFQWPFTITMITYVIAISMYYAWFLAKDRGKQPVEVPAD
jgi:MFS family permease